MKTKGWYSAILAATAAVSIFTGCATRGGGEVFVTEAPPVRRTEIIPVTPGPNYIWVEGHWGWRRNWVWEPGRWMLRPGARAVWESGRWEHARRGWVWREGRWHGERLH